VQAAKERLEHTSLSDEAFVVGFELIRRLEIDSHRADYVMFESARAYAAMDGRTRATVDDLLAVAPLALRQRRSVYMKQFFLEQSQEDEEIRASIESLRSK
jgi:Mg-chelatase subunit ChlI